jgi:hypothetical protein
MLIVNEHSVYMRISDSEMEGWSLVGFGIQFRRVRRLDLPKIHTKFLTSTDPCHHPNISYNNVYLNLAC